MTEMLHREIRRMSTPIGVPPINPHRTPSKSGERLDLSRSNRELSFLTSFKNPRR